MFIQTYDIKVQVFHVINKFGENAHSGDRKNMRRKVNADEIRSNIQYTIISNKNFSRSDTNSGKYGLEVSPDTVIGLFLSQDASSAAASIFVCFLFHNISKTSIYITYSEDGLIFSINL